MVIKHSSQKGDAAPAAQPAVKPIIPVRVIRRPVTMKAKIIAIAVFVLVVLCIGGIVISHKMQLPSAHIQANKYQAVYLVDGSVYFGKLTILSDGSERLTDVYYPQKQTQPNDAAKQEQSSLVKFGSELLGSEDQIIFSKAQVAYWVNLKSDSKVTKAIEAHRDK